MESTMLGYSLALNVILVLGIQVVLSQARKWQEATQESADHWYANYRRAFELWLKNAPLIDLLAFIEARKQLGK